MANETPWYYPPGWDRERMLNATDEESGTMTQEQRDTFREGLHADLGEAGLEDFQAESYMRWKRREKTKEAATVVPEIRNPPPYVETMNLATERNGREWPQWGFVVFRTTPYMDEGGWRAMRHRWDQMIDDQFQDDLDLPGVREAKRKLRFLWVEGPELEGALPAVIASRYQAMGLPYGIVHNVCLCISQASMDAILNSPMPSQLSRRQRKKIPFVLAVTGSAKQPRASLEVGHEEKDCQREDFRGYFNVAVEALLNHLFACTADDMMDPDVLGSRVKGDDIWCNAYRDGIHKTDTGYFHDERGG
ncbi:hypothetical protein EPUS_05637 [Endocarpon pusillum Z07020]|uniref:Uncharacterized protein n=1 Tax=Endocarpon pusillum (strain Z07020 / HMAS-L-300199) TaxID=1263415 RepID=U1G937_ENDPU|nr:uncharacterized protein EPUS_05637 [Endocarpon pusillum Z07020]ERF68498.1 hypothetical protein EPUS_05637 [Endocarpon pusillum Z07020]